MDLPETETVENGDYVFLHFLYGFLALLGISIILSLIKAIYHFYTVRRTHNLASTNDTIDTECHSVAIEPSVTDRQNGITVPDSDRLQIQLDKLRRLLNRLNAMGTFSRDTIGDLSVQTAACANNSKAASSDLSAFWSSIDYDDFEESTINDGKFGKTLTEKSVSPSISDFSLDTSGIPFDNERYKNFATSSRENFLNVPSTLNRPTNPSDAIVEIITILDSIMKKNRSADRILRNSKADKVAEELEKNQSSSENVNSLGMSSSPQKPHFTSVSMNKVSNNKPSNPSIIINMPDIVEQEKLKSNSTRATSRFSCKHASLDQFAHAIETQCKMFSTLSMEAKISSIVNIASPSCEKESYSTKLSSNSLDNKKFSLSQSVSLCIDPRIKMSTQAKGISKSLSAAPGSYLAKSCKDMPKTGTIDNLPCMFEIDAINRSHSLSDLLDKTLLSIESNIAKSYSLEKKPAMHNLNPKSKSQILKSCSQCSTDFPKTLLYNETSKNKNTTSNQTKHVNTKMLNSFSTKCVHSPKFMKPVILKSSISVPEIKINEGLELNSPDLSSSSSDAFLSPLVIDISPCEKADWKSPLELEADISVVRNLTPHNENAVLSRKSFIWSTPPLPKETLTDEMII